MRGKSARKDRVIFRQVCELIPSHLVSKLSRKYEIQSRAITPWSHVVSLIYTQFTHALGLNDVSDGPPRYAVGWSVWLGIPIFFFFL